MNTETVTVIGSGRVPHAMSSYIKDHVIQSATGIKDVLAQQQPIVTIVTSMHSGILTTFVNVRPTGLALTVVLTPTQDTVTLSVTEAALALLPLTAFSAYLILIVIATQLVSVTTTGPETTVVYASTWKHVIQFVTTAMDV